MSQRGPILDRPLEPGWLDAALFIARRDSGVEDKRAAVRGVLRGSGLGETAQKKTATVLNRTWITPEPAADVLVQWAVRAELPEDTRAVHLGAMLAAYPFFGDFMRFIGRSLQLSNRVMTPAIREQMKATWGQRKTVSNATQRGIKTLRAFGLLEGEASSSESVAGERSQVVPMWAPWIAHCLLVARGQSEIGAGELASAPELFGIALPATNWVKGNYEGLEHHLEGGGRSVLAVRR